MTTAAISVYENEAEKMHIRICEAIRSWIFDGKYLSGKRLESVRKIAKEFGVSPVTVLKALDILEEEKLICRVPMKGTFVAPVPLARVRNLNICFAFPEKQFTPDLLGEENYRICFEYHRGILDAIADKNASLQMIYFKDDPAPESIEHQLQKLLNFDIVIFPSRQLERLAAEVSKKVLTFQLLGEKSSVSAAGNIHRVRIDDKNLYKKMAEHISDCGCKTAGIIGKFCINPEEKIPGAVRGFEKIPVFKECCGDFNISVPEKYIWNIDNIESMIGMFEKGDFPDVFYCINAHQIGMVYEAAYRIGLVVGKDFQLIAACSESYARIYHTSLTYFHFSRYEIGKYVAEAAMESVCSGKSIDEIPEFFPIFVQGESTTVKK